MASDQTVSALFDDMAVGRDAMNEVVRGLLGPSRVVDEMAVLFADSNGVFNFVSKAVRLDGVTLFNHARDHITAEPIRSHYQAMYWFLGTPLGFRVEVMLLSEGSPLHDSLRSLMLQTEHEHPPVTAVHASFKCADEDDYGVVCGALRQAGWEQLQRCQAGYGKFSYWHNLDLAPEGKWLLKPRVNLRDGVQ